MLGNTVAGGKCTRHEGKHLVSEGSNRQKEHNAAPSAQARRLRVVNRVGCAALLLAPLLILTAILLTAKNDSERRLAAEIARLETAGVILPLEALVPQVPAGEQNAADIYQQAFASLNLPQTDWDAIDSLPIMSQQHLARAADAVSRNARYYELLDQASRLPHCAFPVPWQARAAATFPHLSQLRQAARWEMVRAEHVAAQGDLDAALDCVSVSLRMAEHIKGEPTVIAQLVAYAMQKVAVGSLATVLSSGDPSPEACLRLRAQISTIAQGESLARSHKGELVLLVLPGFDTYRRSSMLWTKGRTMPNWGDEIIVRSYATPLGQHFLNEDELLSLRVMANQIAAAQDPWPVARQKLRENDDLLAAAPRACSALSLMLSSVESDRIFVVRDASTALLRAAEIGLAVTSYRHTHGSYPASLEELTEEGPALPDDPFDPGQPFRYRADAGGFTIWSIGPNMVDDNDVGYSKGMSLVDGAYDVVFLCRRLREDDL